MDRPISIAVLGAGLIGKRHAESIRNDAQASLLAIVDPAPAAKTFAETQGTRWFSDFKAMIESGKPDGIVVATPNRLHVENGLQAIQAGIPVLVEKPLADSIADGTALIEAAETAGIPLLVGHHRRHNPMIQRAKALIESGKLGRVVTVHAFFWLMKPDDYFDVQWRRETGAGPVLTNLVHDIDLLRYLCGEISAVQAFQSNAVRGFAVDETTVVNLRFDNGALGTVNVSDTVVAPWSWEQTTGENPVYPRSDECCYFIAGTSGSLAVPRLEVWSNEAKPSWWEPFRVERIIAADEDPLRRQIRNFCGVIRGTEQPLVSGWEGLRTIKVIDAIQRAAHSSQTIRTRRKMIDGHTSLIAHIGYPTGTFKAPMIYQPYFDSIGLNVAVVPMGVTANDFPDAFHAITRFTNFHGALITMPHKVSVVGLLGSVSTRVKVAGSCNAVKREAGGRLIGDMFDGEGFVRGVLRKGRMLSGACVLVVGSGGVGSAIAASLADAGVAQIALFDADSASMNGLADRLRVNYPSLQVTVGSNDPARFDVVVNATPLGMKKNDPLPVDVTRISPKTFVGEVVMKQEITPLLAAARDRGCAYQVGTDMLFEQIPAYLEFFGFPTTTPERLRELSRVKYV